jgi:endonuclease III-like uncharacterized protein
MTEETIRMLNHIGFKIGMGQLTKEDVARHLNEYLRQQDEHFAQVVQVLKQHEEREELCQTGQVM